MQVDRLPVRYRERVVVLPSGCWEWQGARNYGGYGTVYADGRNGVAHRLTYRLLVGPIPEGLQLDHLCRFPPCVNPAHLEPVTGRENILRGIGATAQNARKAACIKGHPLDEENTYVNTVAGVQWRECRACRRDQQTAYRERRRAARKLAPPKVKAPIATCCGQTFWHPAGLMSHRRKAIHVDAYLAARAEGR